MPISMPTRAVSNDTKVIGREPQDRYAEIRNECYEELVQVAKQLTSEQGISNYATVFPNEMLLEMAANLPTTREELLAVPQCTEYKLTRFNAESRFLEITLNYLSILGALKEEERDQQMVVTASSSELLSSTAIPIGKSRGSSTIRGRSRRGLRRAALNEARLLQFSVDTNRSRPPQPVVPKRVKVLPSPLVEVGSGELAEAISQWKIQ
ncbi:unnamed protein product [Echinostoma caproni]|uniref:HRDC domain-containing protein n=1 Tax=Echinostoma caproni TaxID=27848 RepID=A0A3P8H805_9TREM|nr:unnamed protein product [Echinostoma caproni]